MTDLQDIRSITCRKYRKKSANMIRVRSLSNDLQKNKNEKNIKNEKKYLTE